MECVDGDEDDPGKETEYPRMPRGPELEDELSSGKIRGKGDSIVEPVVP